MWKTKIAWIKVFHRVTSVCFVDKRKHSENLLDHFTGYISYLVATLLSLQG